MAASSSTTRTRAPTDSTNRSYPTHLGLVSQDSQATSRFTTAPGLPGITEPAFPGRFKDASLDALVGWRYHATSASFDRADARSGARARCDARHLRLRGP